MGTLLLATGLTSLCVTKLVIYCFLNRPIPPLFPYFCSFQKHFYVKNFDYVGLDHHHGPSSHLLFNSGLS